jgi:hypothetical protein
MVGPGPCRAQVKEVAQGCRKAASERRISDARAQRSAGDEVAVRGSGDCAVPVTGPSRSVRPRACVFECV